MEIVFHTYNLVRGNSKLEDTNFSEKKKYLYNIYEKRTEKTDNYVYINGNRGNGVKSDEYIGV